MSLFCTICYRRVYLSLLDSVHFYQGATRRREVYHSIIHAYVIWCCKMGYVCSPLHRNNPQNIHSIKIYHLRLPGTYGAIKNQWKSDPRCTFTSIILLLDHLSKIWEAFFDQVAKDVTSVFTFSRWPLMAELKMKMAEFAVFWILLISALILEVTFKM